MKSKHRLRAILLVATIVGLLVSAIGSLASTSDFILHHIATVVFIAWLVKYHQRLGLDDVSFVMIFVFVALHIVGARYLYSNVPYNEWSESLLGFNLNEFFGFERNHFDRVIHFLFGFLFQRPVRQILDRWIDTRGWILTLLAIVTIGSMGAIYEVIEWGIAATLSPETAENYNGQQGDMWDAQKDMALAYLGAALIACVRAGRAPATPRG